MAEKNVIGFHNPDEQYGFLSNWFLSDFEYDSVRYSSMEQYMMYQKAILFADLETAEQILGTKDVAVIKSLGRSIKNYEDWTWNGLRQLIVYRGLLEKFGQTSELKKLLLDTGSSILAECAVKDRIWGIGLSMEDERRLNPQEWRGQNLLGYALMDVREQLRRLYRLL